VSVGRQQLGQFGLAHISPDDRKLHIVSSKSVCGAVWIILFDLPYLRDKKRGRIQNPAALEFLSYHHVLC
jgi:hypothetical protein